jgi:5-formyltetrahydrofolate cyclo-ligase
MGSSTGPQLVAMDSKLKIRTKALKFRNSLSQSDRVLRDARIIANLESLECFQNTLHILFFWSVEGETDTHALIDKTIEEKKLYLPVTRGKSHMQAIPIHKPLRLKMGHEGIPEPMEQEPNSFFDHQVELVVVPGVAFDPKGNRLGMGKGYYDRYLASVPQVIRVALAYEEQVLDHVPKESYDVPMDWIVTDRRILQCNP